MIPVIVVAMLALAALWFVAAPVTRRSAREREDEADPRSALEERRDAALEALVDLEEEADMGKLDSGELALLKERYEREALEALAALDSVGLVGSDDPLEAEIAAVRQRLTCPSCGAPRSPDAPCPRCGA